MFIAFSTREIGSTYVQLIPCVEPKEFRTTAPQHWDPADLPVIGTPAARPGTPGAIVTDWSVNPDDYGAFLCKVFDEWYRKDLGRVLVDLFETAVVQWMGMPAKRCITGEFCGKGLALEHDGSVYSCDHYVYPEYCLGNIRERPISEMVFSRRQMDFGFAKRDGLPQYCRDCKYLFACGGECPKDRFIRTPDGQVGLNYLCSGLKQFFEHADPYLKQIAGQLKGVNCHEPSPPQTASVRRHLDAVAVSTALDRRGRIRLVPGMLGGGHCVSGPAHQ